MTTLHALLQVRLAPQQLGRPGHQTMVSGRQITELQLPQQLRQVIQMQQFLLKLTQLSLLNPWDKVQALFFGNLEQTTGGLQQLAVHLHL